VDDHAITAGVEHDRDAVDGSRTDPHGDAPPGGRPENRQPSHTVIDDQQSIGHEAREAPVNPRLRSVDDLEGHEARG
jgi:hypothetical protein